MHRAIFFVVMCAVAGDSVSHILIDTNTGNVGVATTEDSRSSVTLNPEDAKADVLSAMINPGLKVKRVKRHFIKHDWCPTGEVRVFGNCVTCEFYETDIGDECPWKKQQHDIKHEVKKARSWSSQQKKTRHRKHHKCSHRL
ncbi:hypothetical protein B5X24_HaOG215161 [Helicoverpa armigera]|nr:hypothetical protein B5X24_HaOG215161 [Helicoverpa armigera]